MKTSVAGSAPGAPQGSAQNSVQDLAAGGDGYSDLVLARFDAPQHAISRLGAMTGEWSGARRSRAESRTRSAWVEFELASDSGNAGDAAGKVVEARFRAKGCPHLVAGADLVAERLKGMTIDSLAHYDAGFLERELPLPLEKLDIRLLLEDAVRGLAGHEASNAGNFGN